MRSASPTNSVNGNRPLSTAISNCFNSSLPSRNGISTSLRRFYEDTLGQLVEHDERKQGDLIRTLNGFFQANGNLAKAAQDLDVHRNTLVYRLERIAELTEMNLDDADNRLILHLALKIQRVLATLTPGVPV